MKRISLFSQKLSEMEWLKICILLLACVFLIEGATVSNEEQLGKFTKFVYEGRSYMVSGYAVNWHAAGLACNDMGMKLVSIESEAEMTAIRNEINGQGDDFWTSGTDQAQEGVFVWEATGQIVSYSNWNSGEPNNFFNVEDCIKLIRSDDFQWNDTNCDDKDRFVCEDST